MRRRRGRLQLASHSTLRRSKLATTLRSPQVIHPPVGNGVRPRSGDLRGLWRLGRVAGLTREPAPQGAGSYRLALLSRPDWFPFAKSSREPGRWPMREPMSTNLSRYRWHTVIASYLGSRASAQHIKRTRVRLPNPDGLENRVGVELPDGAVFSDPNCQHRGLLRRYGQDGSSLLRWTRPTLRTLPTYSRYRPSHVPSQPNLLPANEIDGTTPALT
jgi:hypothetical protein